ncbi:MAG: helix-turn-helix domain-containing protein [Cytophagales bacterium]|nr:MAG: helix-turn-helix domain-containing protein [Cytophagales bacterium]
MKKIYPTYCIANYPENDGLEQIGNTFYITKLSSLVQGFPNIDKPHTHTFYMLMIVTQGTGRHTIDFVDYPIHAFATFFLTPGQVHSWELSPNVDGYAIFFEANFFIQTYKSRLYEYPFFNSQESLPYLAISGDTNFIHSMLTYQYQTYLAATPTKPDILLAYLYIILEYLKRIYDEQPPKQVNSPHFSKWRNFEILLNEHFSKKKEVGEYAKMMNISANYLNVLCKNSVGKTASQLIQERIITEAKRLLVHTSLNIKEISYQLGFEDYAYFSRFFKKYAQLTAEGFRKSHK